MCKIIFVLFCLVCSGFGRRIQTSSAQQPLQESVSLNKETLEVDGNDATPVWQPSRRKTVLIALATFLKLSGSFFIERFLRKPSWNGAIGRGILSLVEQFLRPVGVFIAALPPIRTPSSFQDEVKVGERLLHAKGNITSLITAGLDSITPFKVLPSREGHIVTVSSFRRLETAMHGSLDVTVGPLRSFHHTSKHDLDVSYELEDVELRVVWNLRLNQHRAINGTVDHRAFRISLFSVEAKVDKVSLIHSSVGPPGLMQLLSKTLSQKLKKDAEEAIAENLYATLSENLSTLLEGFPQIVTSSSERRGQ